MADHDQRMQTAIREDLRGLVELAAPSWAALLADEPHESLEQAAR